MIVLGSFPGGLLWREREERETRRAVVIRFFRRNKAEIRTGTPLYRSHVSVVSTQFRIPSVYLAPSVQRIPDVGTV